MMPTTYTYVFDPRVPADEVEATLLLAVVATECLHGATPVRLDAAARFDPATRTCAIASVGRVGTDLNKLFAGLADREFGPDGFTVARTADPVPA